VGVRARHPLAVENAVHCLINLLYHPKVSRKHYRVSAMAGFIYKAHLLTPFPRITEIYKLLNKY